MSPGKYSFRQVMLIDDSEIDILVNRRLMQITAFSENVIVASCAEEGLHYLKEECRSADDAPEWIFLDVHLPGKSGYEFIEDFASLPDFVRSKSRIIILSVFQKQEYLQKALESPYVHGQLDKPLTQQALREIAVAHSSPINASF
ncbi:MAG: response regulator [Bacteroidia bacterium]|nr:response regulator [Bacteroidia bacterium]